MNAPQNEDCHDQESSDRLLSIDDIARWFGVSRAWVYDHTTRKRPLLPCIRFGEMTRFSKSDVEDFNVRQGFLTEAQFLERLYPQLLRHLKALAACAFYCGGRKSEWLRVDWPEVDFEAMVIRFLKTKNKHPREVPIIEGVMLDSLLEALRLHNAAWPEEPAVFVYDGHRMTTVGDAWDKACERAGFKGLLFHDMRRSANKLMRDRGVGQHARMEIMGHLTSSMDERYGIVDRADIDQAREKMKGEKPKLRRLK